METEKWEDQWLSDLIEVAGVGVPRERKLTGWWWLEMNVEEFQLRTGHNVLGVRVEDRD